MNTERAIKPTTKELGDAELEEVTGGAGSGAGKVTFNSFTITRKSDRASPGFFQN